MKPFHRRIVRPCFGVPGREHPGDPCMGRRPSRGGRGVCPGCWRWVRRGDGHEQTVVLTAPWGSRPCPATVVNTPRVRRTEPARACRRLRASLSCRWRTPCTPTPASWSAPRGASTPTPTRPQRGGLRPGHTDAAHLSGRRGVSSAMKRQGAARSDTTSVQLACTTRAIVHG
jgi:hypothetical protein